MFVLVSGSHRDKQYICSSAFQYFGQLLKIWDCPGDSGTDEVYESVTIVSVIFIHICPIERCITTLVVLYLDSRDRSYQKQKLKVNVWYLCTGIATLWIQYCYLWAKTFKKNTKNDVILKSPGCWD